MASVLTADLAAGPVTALNAVTTATASNPITMVPIRRCCGVQVVHTGSPSTVTLTLEGSLDGVNWFTLATWSSGSLSSGAIVWAADKPVSQVRANLGTLSGGTSPTVTALLVAG